MGENNTQEYYYKKNCFNQLSFKNKEVDRLKNHWQMEFFFYLLQNGNICTSNILKCFCHNDLLIVFDKLIVNYKRHSFCRGNSKF